MFARLRGSALTRKKPWASAPMGARASCRASRATASCRLNTAIFRPRCGAGHANVGEWGGAPLQRQQGAGVLISAGSRRGRPSYRPVPHRCTLHARYERASIHWHRVGVWPDHSQHSAHTRPGRVKPPQASATCYQGRGKAGRACITAVSSEAGVPGTFQLFVCCHHLNP